MGALTRAVGSICTSPDAASSPSTVPRTRISPSPVSFPTRLVARGLAKAVGGRGSVVAVDIAPRMLELARKSAPANVRFVYMPAERLVFRDASFDLLTMGLSLAYLVDPFAALADAHRVLKPGARIAVSCQRRGLSTEAQS